MKVKLQIMIEETLKNDFIETCNKVGLDMSEVIRLKVFEFIRDNKVKNYCTQNNGDCDTCNLVNYNKDCQNNTK